MPLINLSSNLPKFFVDAKSTLFVDFPRRLEDTVDESMDLLIDNIKYYIPGPWGEMAPGQRFESTGALKESFGFQESRVVGGRTEAVAGSDLHYAPFVDQGFTMAERRRVALGPPAFDRRVPVWIEPFTFEGYHFVENGIADSEDAIQDYFRRRTIETIQVGLSGIPAAFSKQRKQFQAARQNRDARGRFAPGYRY